MNEAKYAAELTRRAEIIRRVVKKNPKEVTDRAHRYRAQENIKSDKKQCAWCGKKNLKGRDAMVAHKDGDESNDNPKNLAWTCRSCNALEANRQKRLGKGRRTRQFNPTTKNKKKHGCTSLAQWSAMMNIVGVKQGGVRYPAGDQDEVNAAWEMIEATPPEKRKAYNAKLYARVKRRPKSEVPF